MKKLLLLLLLAGTAFADGPISRFKDADTDQEFQNVYQDIRNPVIDNGKAKLFSVTSLRVSTMTLVSSATVTNLTVTNINGAAYSAGGTPGQLQGTATNDNAAAGKVGEYIESVVGDTAFPGASADYADLTSISLTAGDWDVSGIVYHERATATWSGLSSAIANSSGNTCNDCVIPANYTGPSWANSSSTPGAIMDVIPPYRVSLSGTSTRYLKTRVVFTAGTARARGRISARRVR